MEDWWMNSVNANAKGIQSHERIWERLDQCDVEKDIEHFIETHGTGGHIPGNFYHVHIYLLDRYGDLYRLIRVIKQSLQLTLIFSLRRGMTSLNTALPTSLEEEIAKEKAKDHPVAISIRVKAKMNHDVRLQSKVITNHLPNDCPCRLSEKAGSSQTATRKFTQRTLLKG